MATKKHRTRKRIERKKVVLKQTTPKRKVTKKTPLRKPSPRKATLKMTRVRGASQSVETVALEPEELRARSGGQAGDLQGLANVADADSESVDELLEEGNAFEADIVKGVQDAADADESEVVTHEVPEDDVPEEYLDKDR
jgi:hypothetical protein